MSAIALLVITRGAGRAIRHHPRHRYRRRVAIFWVQVTVALRRPPREGATLYFQLEADSGMEAELLACRWSTVHPQVVMPVRAVVLDWPDDAP